ncbi:YebO family protein [Erwinia sp. V71]|uniref:YebO family protein n=1 Tax=Erwinia sp. V71 TaxID=3369424 RepID=UPI003F60611A
MNEMANGAMGFASLGFIAALVIIGLIAWFFVNRASEQIELLQALLDEQKKQNAVLRRLAERVCGTEKSSEREEDGDKDFTRLIPER